MDAISFVLGVRSAQLRSSQLKDLVYRGRRLAKDAIDGAEAEVGAAEVEEEEEEDTQEEGNGEGDAKSAWVLAVFEDNANKEWIFKRS